MNEGLVIGGAIWLGLLTSISPCPLASNLAAIAYLSRRVESRGKALAGAAAYTLGRVAAYAAIAALLGLGVVGAPEISQNLQRWIGPLLGPLLILTAMVLLGLITLPFQMSATSQEKAGRWAERGLWGEFVLGFLFALSFCPVSAALFFGGLIPLALGSGQPALLLVLYGIGTAAPIAVLALVMAFSMRAASRAAGRINKARPWIAKITGVLLLLVGLYLTADQTLSIL
jgi:cytochrome c biogenesis protein CcdA